MFLVFKMMSASAEETLSLTVIDQNFNSSDRIVIDQEAIKRSRSNNLPQILASQANIVITSTNFQPNSVFVRGGDSSHVLFIVDDVPTYDASTLQKVINLGSMNVANIKRIEILKGSQSVLYGGQALSAVIKIYTIPDEFKNSGKAIIQGGDKVGDGAVGIDHQLSDNFLVAINSKYKDAKNPSPVLDSKEYYAQKTTTADLAMVYKIDSVTRVTLKLSYSNDDNQVPTTVQPLFKAVDTKDFGFITKSFGTAAVFKKADLFSVSVSSQKNGRQLFQDAANSPINAKTDYDYVGELLNSRFEFYLPRNQVFSGVLGATSTGEKFEESDLTNGMKSLGSNQYQGAFAKIGVQAVPELLLVEAGYRREDGVDSYQTGLTLWKDLKLEYSTGFKAPSLAQLYSAMYGNPNLRPEKSETVNLSYEAKINDNLQSSISVFDSNYKNLFVFVAGKYENVATTRTTGAEWSIGYGSQDLGLNYQLFLSYQEPYDSSTRTWLIKRPLRSAGAKFSHFFMGDQLSATLEFNHVGERRDRETSSRYTTVNAYNTVALASNYKITTNTEVFARVDNLTNQTYQQGYGYYEYGVKGRVGFQVGY